MLTKLEADGVAVDVTPERELALPDPDDESFLGEAARSILPGPLHGDLAQRKSVVSTLTGSNRVRGKYDNLLDRPLHDPFTARRGAE